MPKVAASRAGTTCTYCERELTWEEWERHAHNPHRARLHVPWPHIDFGAVIKTLAVLLLCTSGFLYGFHLLHGGDLTQSFRMVANDVRVVVECPTNLEVQREMLFRQPSIFGEVWDGEMVKLVCSSR